MSITKLEVVFLDRKQQKEYITINDARINKFKIDWKNEKISKPDFLGVKIIDNLDLNVLKNYIDWSPFLEHGICMAVIPIFWRMKLSANKQWNYLLMLIKCLKKSFQKSG